MNKKKKIILSLIALCLAVTLVAGSAMAFFIAYETTNDVGTVGTVGLNVSPITVGHNAVYKMNGNTVTSELINSSTSASTEKIDLSTAKLNTYSWKTVNGVHPACEYWVYSEGGYALSDVYFRAKITGKTYSGSNAQGSVAYCVDDGKLATDATFTNGYSNNTAGTTTLSETTVVSEDVKRVLEAGYPNVKYGAYDMAYNDSEMEWATSVAIFIAEGDAYNNSGEYFKDHVIRLDKMSIDGTGDALLVPYCVRKGESSFTSEDYLAELATSTRLKQLVADILDAAERITVVDEFYINNVDAYAEPQYALEKIPSTTAGVVAGSDYKLKGYKVGPFYLDNTIGQATLTMNVSGSNSSDISKLVFWDNAGNEFTTLEATYNDPFYVYVPLSLKNADINITATAKSKTAYPMYYYWDGNKAHQRMVVCEEVTPVSTVKIPSVMYDDYTYWNPGDVMTVHWSVENTGNKSVVTRHIVSLYWENNNLSTYGNQKDIVYIYPENTSASKIFAEQFPTASNQFLKDITKYKSACMSTCSYKQLGSMSTVYANGKKYNCGYSFIVYGDALDGTGEGSEIGDAFEQNYSTIFDETLANKDELAFKLCLSSAANNYTQGQKLVIKVETQAIQYRNTSDAEWDKLFKKSYCLTGSDTHTNADGSITDHTLVPHKTVYDTSSSWDSQWQTIAAQEYVIGTGNVSAADPMNNNTSGH